MILGNSLYNIHAGREEIPTPDAHIGVDDIKDHAIAAFENLFYGQFKPQSRRESKATIRHESATFFLEFSVVHYEYIYSR